MQQPPNIRITFWVVLCLMVLSLNGCIKVGPNFSRPHAPCKQEWIDADSEKVSITEKQICCWWKAFNDPILDKLIYIAYDQNLPLQIACYRIMEARARLGIAIGEFFPQLQEGIGSANREKLSKNAPNIGPTPDLYFKDYQLGFQAAWELDFWGKFRRAIESERAELCSSYANYDNVLVLLLSDVAAIYVQTRTIEEQIDIILENIKVQERSLQIVNAQFQGGFVSELDVQQATTLLRGTEARLPDLERQHRQAQNALSVLLGIAPQDLDCLLEGHGKIPDADSEIWVNMPESLLYRRPDVRQALFDAAAQSARIGVAFADFFPQISLTGVIALNSSGDSIANVNMSSGNLLSRDSLSFNYGTNFAWPLLNYGRITNRVRVEKTRFCQLVINYQNIVLRAYQEVEDGLVAFLKFQEQEEYLAESVKAAQRSVDLSVTQYVEGMVDYTRVLNTEQSLINEAENHALAKGEIALGLISTYRALGGGWELKYHFEECYEEKEKDAEEFMETPVDKSGSPQWRGGLF
ncbi:MAG: Toluene efflux pump outer membrane protein TtgI [Chlamydiae bacterium]|nr:Toluene efflux pump outer membrane protein TtgI [Chlamydiota bacterium]